MFGDTPVIFAPGGGASGGGAYPITAYGFIAASDSVASFTTTSGLANFYVRVPVPKNRPIAVVATVVIGAGTLGAGGLNGYSVYSDAGALLGSTVSDDALWSTPGWRVKALSATIPGQGADRFVIVGMTVNGYVVAPSIPYIVMGPSSGDGLGGGNGVTNRRSFFTGGIASWPASINPATEGTTSNYLPLVAIG